LLWLERGEYWVSQVFSQLISQVFIQYSD
jgi:hypothetical protein